MTTTAKTTITQTANKRHDLEEQFIGSLAGALVDTLQVAGWLDAAVFSDPNYAELWRRVQTAGADVDRFWDICSELGIRDDAYAAMDRTVSWQFGGHIASELTRMAWLDRANTRMAALAKATVDGDHQTAARLLEELRESQPKASQAIKVRDMSDAGVSFLEMIGSASRNILTGIPILDQATAGLERQHMTILAAPPSTGKSALSFQIARNIAASGKTCLFFSLEMSEANLFARAACGAAGVTWLDVRRNTITTAQRQAVERVASELMFALGPRLLIHDRAGTTLAQIWQMVAQTRPDVFVVDHLRFVADQHGENENKRLGFVSQRLFETAKQFECHCLALSQLSRSQKERSDKRPILTDLRDSGELEENADNVWMLHVPADGTSTIMDRSKVQAELWIRKARDGVRDACVNLKFDRRMQWFE